MRVSLRILNVLVTVNLLVSALHFGDNMLHFREYPEPAWITGRHVVDLLWFAISPVLLGGWWLARQGRRAAAVSALWVYCVLSLFVLGHYLYADPSELSFRINVLIIAEAAAAATLLILTPFLVPSSAQGRLARWPLRLTCDNMEASFTSRSGHPASQRRAV